MLKQKVIGVYIGGFDSRFPLLMLKGIHAIAREKNIKIIYVSAGTENVQSQKELSMRQEVLKLLKLGIDGLILITATVNRDTQFAEEILYLKENFLIPIVFIGSPLEGYDSLLIDNVRTYKELVYLVLKSNKDRKYLFISGPLKHDFVKDRLRGFHIALEQLGIPIDSNREIFLNNHTSYDGGQGVKEAIEKNIDFDIVFCINDELALGASAELVHRGYKIPDDIWITGFDNIPETMSAIPNITTVERGGYYAGMEAVLKILYPDYCTEYVSYPWSIEWRESTGNYFLENTNDISIHSLDELADCLIGHFKPPFLLPSFPSKELWIDKFLIPLMESLKSKEVNFNSLQVLIKSAYFHILDLSLWPRIIEYIGHFDQYLSTFLDIPTEALRDRLRVLGHFIINQYSLREYQEQLSFYELNQKLSVSASQYSMTNFLDTMAQEVQKFGVHSLSVSFWDSDKNWTLREILRLDPGGEYKIKWPKGQAYTAKKLWEQYYSHDSEAFTLFLPLFGAEESFGILVLELVKPCFIIIESIRSVISVALQSSYLLSEIRKQSEKLEATVNVRTKALQELNKKMKIQIATKELLLDKLRRSEKRYRDFFENDLTGDFIVNNKLRVLDCNVAFARIFGYKNTNQAIGSSMLNYFPLYEDFKRLAKQFFRTKSFEYLETQLVRPDGKVVDIIANIIGTFDENGCLQSIRGYVFDNTPRKSLERQMIQNQKLEGLGRLAGGIAHDFNNLLTVINGYSELILAELEEKSPYYSDISEIREAGIKAASLTNQLLSFSRKKTVSLSSLSLNKIIRGMETLFERFLGEHILLNFYLEAQSDYIKGDKSQVEQVLMNLVLNAKDALGGGGHLTVKTSNVQLKETLYLIRGALLPGEYLLLTVKDDGEGMEEEVKAHIFEPFYTTKGHGQGTGLGMATVYGIIEQMKADIKILTKPGYGTSFEIYFKPIQQGSKDDKEKLSSSRLVSNNRECPILLVEDEAPVREFASRVLRQAGYDVKEACNGNQALEYAQTYTKAPFLITDVIMAGMSGPELAKRLKSRFKFIKTLFISGYADDYIQKHGIASEELCLLHKPFKSEEILQKLEEMLQD
ncbi:ATP-binding protein [Spirochaeta cellobiosiphila]|uniref:ATP-binding protein n=1 Tax=Spirochaeta cellobiosiphila TaxID=504483 RepID=UPI0004156D51|nr:ATP-binding protein [Spirochaeta cellobiosiphila]